jgi:hypothetical protein
MKIFKAYFDYGGELVVRVAEARETKNMVIVGESHGAWGYRTNIKKNEVSYSEKDALDALKKEYRENIAFARAKLVRQEERLGKIEAKLKEQP